MKFKIDTDDERKIKKFRRKYVNNKMEKEFKEIKKVALNHAKRVDEEVYKRLTRKEETSLSSKQKTDCGCVSDKIEGVFTEEDVREAIKDIMIVLMPILIQHKETKAINYIKERIGEDLIK